MNWSRAKFTKVKARYSFVRPKACIIVTGEIYEYFLGVWDSLEYVPADADEVERLLNEKYGL